eukprot:m.47797 g.47797  ORF g.47797 m.47797 type:complete len:271 (-) comp8882_c0_seq4:2279-3091(-)
MDGRVARIRQVVLAARHLDSAVSSITTLFHTENIHTDPALLPELQNAMMPIGDCFWEVVNPMMDVTSAGRYLDKFGVGLTHRAESGYMLEIQVADVEGVERRWESAGNRVILRPGRNNAVEAVRYERGHLNRPGLSGVHWHPKDVGLIVETAQHVPPRRWLYAGVDWECAPQRTDVATGFCGAEIAVNDPVGMAKTWAFGLGAQLGADGTSILLGAGEVVRFRRKMNDREDGLVAVDVRTASEGPIGTSRSLCGVTVNFCSSSGHAESRL